MDSATVDRHISSENERLPWQKRLPWVRADKRFGITIPARDILDEDGNGKISLKELRNGLAGDRVFFDPVTRRVTANRSRIPVDASVFPKDRSDRFDTVEQCMEFVMRYFHEERAKEGLGTSSFDSDFGGGRQYNISSEFRSIARNPGSRSGYAAYENGQTVPPRAGDVLVAESTSSAEFHIALITAVEPKEDGWEVSVYQANVPYNSNSHKLEDHIQKFPMEFKNGRWTLPVLPTSRYGYDADMEVVGWLHPYGNKALPQAMANEAIK